MGNGRLIPKTIWANHSQLWDTGWIMRFVTSKRWAALCCTSEGKDGVTGGWGKERGEHEGRKRSQSYKYNMLCGMEKDPLQKDKKKKRGKKGVGTQSAPARSPCGPWMTPHTSSQLPCCLLTYSQLAIYFSHLKFTTFLFWSSVMYSIY